MFYRVKLINKGTELLRETYAGIWHDSEIGNASNDLVGVDVDLSMGYAFDDGGDSVITDYFDGQSVAQGIDLLQGPMVDCTEDDFIDITLAGSDANGDNLAYNIRSGPSNGTATFISQNTVRYTPNTGFSGNDSFEYDAHDGTDQSNLATVTILVTDGGGKGSLNNNLSVSENEDDTHSNSSIKFSQSSSLLTDLHSLSSKHQNQLISVMKNLDLSHKKDEHGFIRCGIDDLKLNYNKSALKLLQRENNSINKLQLKRVN